jgi:hypothetical protein
MVVLIVQPASPPGHLHADPKRGRLHLIQETQSKGESGHGDGSYWNQLAPGREGSEALPCRSRTAGCGAASEAILSLSAPQQKYRAEPHVSYFPILSHAENRTHRPQTDQQPRLHIPPMI